jgi:hypothetical protein
VHNQVSLGGRSDRLGRPPWNSDFNACAPNGARRCKVFMLRNLIVQRSYRTLMRSTRSRRGIVGSRSTRMTRDASQIKRQSPPTSNAPNQECPPTGPLPRPGTVRVCRRLIRHTTAATCDRNSAAAVVSCGRMPNTRAPGPSTNTAGDVTYRPASTRSAGSRPLCWFTDPRADPSARPSNATKPRSHAETAGEPRHGTPDAAADCLGDRLLLRPASRRVGWRPQAQ